jgi:hypothetical protein
MIISIIIIVIVKIHHTSTHTNTNTAPSPHSQTITTKSSIPILITNRPPPLNLPDFRPTPLDLIATRFRAPQALLAQFSAKRVWKTRYDGWTAAALLSVAAGQFGHNVALAFGAGDWG